MSQAEKIVVIDDDVLQLRQYQRRLRDAGYQVTACMNAFEAIEHIDESVDVIVADMLLGYNTIFPLLNELQSQAVLCDIPIIVASNMSETVSLEALQSYGVKKVLHKMHMHPDDIVAAVRSVA